MVSLFQCCIFEFVLSVLSVDGNRSAASKEGAGGNDEVDQNGRVELVAGADRSRCGAPGEVRC